MKKDIEWIKDKLFEIAWEENKSQYLIKLEDVYEVIDQLDELEVLSQEWIDEHEKRERLMGPFGDVYLQHVVPSRYLKKLLVPKQGELETKIQELIESYQQEKDAYSNPENGWIDGFIEDLKNLVEKEQKYYILGKYDTPILFRDHRNRITETSNLSDIYPKANSEDFEFTEQEIKDYDERYWAFRKPVDE